MNNCCISDKNKTGFWYGLFTGLLPHTFCILFVVFSAIGAVGLTGVMRKFLVIPYFFSILILVSLVFSTISAWVYLKKFKCHNFSKKYKIKYLLTMYGVTLAINLLMIGVVFPKVANVYAKDVDNSQSLAVLSVDVVIPCSGHAPLISGELSQESGVSSVEFKIPNHFEIRYNPEVISSEQIRSNEVFKNFKIIN